MNLRLCGRVYNLPCPSETRPTDAAVVAVCLPGVIQVDALLANQLRVTPYMLSLPSNISQPTTLSLNLTWDPAAAPAAAAAAAAPAAAVTYSVQHEPAAAITVSNGWYGSARAIEYVYQAADVRFNSSKVAVNTSAGAQTELKVRLLGCAATRLACCCAALPVHHTQHSRPAVADFSKHVLTHGLC